MIKKYIPLDSMTRYGKSRRMDRAFCVYSFWEFLLDCLDGYNFYRPATAPTSAQPKSIAIAGDSTVFVVEIGTVEAFRSNQKLFQQNPSYQPSAVDARGNLIAIGGEVRTGTLP